MAYVSPAAATREHGVQTDSMHGVVVPASIVQATPTGCAYPKVEVEAKQRTDEQLLDVPAPLPQEDAKQVPKVTPQVRSMLTIEQAPDPLSQERVLQRTVAQIAGVPGPTKQDI